MLKTHGEGPKGHWEWVALSAAQNGLDFCGGSGNLALAVHVGSLQIGYHRIARAESYSGCIRFPFNSAPPRSYDTAGGGGNSVELNWGTHFVGCEEIKITHGRGTHVAGIIVHFSPFS
jgi:hypothetical protein